MKKLSTLAAVLVAAAAVVAGAVTATADTADTSGRPPFLAKIERVSPQLEKEMIGVSWREGCPVPIADLRLITMTYRNFDGKTRRGELMVHHEVARDVVDVFRTMYNGGFPIRRMERIEHYGGSDDASMDADNTSAFNCRAKTGGGGYSIHSYGKAIDINTIENPYIDGDLVLPPAGEEFVDRDDVRPGMILADDYIVRAFERIGFEWGGYWDSPIDYQHFEATDVN